MDKFSDDILAKVFSYFPMKRWNCILLTCKRFNEIGKKVFDPSIKHDRALMSAVTRKNFKLVSYLLKDPRVNPSSFHDVTIRSACKEGQTEIVKQLLKDKNGCYSLRELATMLLIVVLIASWIARQFFGKDIPEFMFYSFASLVGAGCFGYSIEKKTTVTNN